MSFPKYPEIALVKRRPEIFSVKQVVATEKLHGSNFRVHFPMGMTDLKEVKYGSRDMEHGEQGFPLGRAVQWFESRPNLLSAMWEVVKSYGFADATLFGEACGPGIKAKGVKYTGGSEMLFRAFHLMVGSNFVTYDLFTEIADKMELPRVPELWRGEPTPEAFDGLLEKPSLEGARNGIISGDNVAEGVVIQSTPLLRNVFGEWLIVKHKAAKFSEEAQTEEAQARAKQAAESKAEATAVTMQFASTYVTPGRVTNLLGRLADRGVVLTNDMKDMPLLMREMIADLHKECDAEWKATGRSDKEMGAAVSKVLAPLYREHLANEAK